MLDECYRSERMTVKRKKRGRSRPPRRRLHFERLSPTQFEEFVVDLLDELGLVNIDWRKGTGKKTSPSDSGRDIVCQEVRHEMDGSVHFERWFIDCKHSTRGLPVTELQNLLAWAQAERPDVALFVLSNFLSNAAKDYLDAYRNNQRPPFKIKLWERPTVEKVAGSKVALLRKHNLIEEPIRSLQAILKAEEEFFDKIWYDRHMQLMERYKADKTTFDPQVLKGAFAAAERKRKQYGAKNLGPWSTFEWGMLNGKLSALRWVLGSEWDFLDT